MGPYGVFSVIHTAQEGSLLGGQRKNWHALWIPIRSIVGLSVLVPTPATGYSLIQVAVMWIVLQGIGAADVMWGITLNALNSGISATTGTISDDTLPTTGANIAPNIFNAAMCMQTVIAVANANPAGGNYLYTEGNSIQNFAIQKTFTDSNGNQVPYSSTGSGAIKL